MEIAFCMEDSIEKTKNEIGFFPDSITMQNYYKDSLTKAYSRAYIDNFYSNYEKAKGVAVADIDNFKSINDHYGHIVGDLVLKHVSAVMSACISKSDVLIRYGGDEFILLFQEIDEKDFREKLKSIQKMVNESVIQDYPDLRFSISIGGAYNVMPLNKAIDTADKVMYYDKMKTKE